jgi:predicted nucleic acid-binding protein
VGTAGVGVILDSSVLIAAERRSQTVRQILEQLEASQGNTECGLSVVTVAELTHGAYHAKTEAMKERRLAFIDELCRDISVHAVTLENRPDCGTDRRSTRSSRHTLCIRRLADWRNGFALRICGGNSEYAPFPVNSGISNCASLMQAF